MAGVMFFHGFATFGGAFMDFLVVFNNGFMGFNRIQWELFAIWRCSGDLMQPGGSWKWICQQCV